MGAGAAISEGKKARMLTNTKATKNISTMRNGAIYWRKNVMVMGLNRSKIENKNGLCLIKIANVNHRMVSTYFVSLF